MEVSACALGGSGLGRVAWALGCGGGPAAVGFHTKR
jgi:hypothetical protein